MTAQTMVWDNSNCVFAVLPSCLKLGSNPPDGYYTPAGMRWFPVYQGPSAPYKVTADMYFDGTSYPKAIYENGLLDFRNTASDAQAVSPNDRNARIICNYKHTLSNSMAYTIEVWSAGVPKTDATGMLREVNFAGFRCTVKTNVNTHDFYIPAGPRIITGPSILTIMQSLSHTQYFDATRSSSYTRSSATTLADYPGDTWRRDAMNHYVAVVTASSIRLFVNGNELLYPYAYVNSVPPPGSAFVPWTYGSLLTNEFFMGSSLRSNWWGNRGTYAATIFYDAALTPERVRNNYQLGPTLGKLQGYINDDNTIRLIRELSDSEKPTNSFTSIGMPQATFNSPSIVSRDTQLSNPKGSVVDNSEGDRSVNDRPLGTSSGSGASLESYSKPSWLY